MSSKYLLHDVRYGYVCWAIKGCVMYFLSPCDAIIISCQSLMASSSIIIGYQDPGAGAFVFSHILHYPLHFAFLCCVYLGNYLDAYLSFKTLY
jgi:hypothetical protein